jgi:hypothetical protein
MPKRRELDLASFNAASQTIDTAKLAEVVQDAFLMSMDGRLSEAVQGSYYANGVTLRAQLRELLIEVFEADTPELLRANATIKQVNTKLKAVKAQIDQAAKVLEDLGALVAQLDKLLQIVDIAL